MGTRAPRSRFYDGRFYARVLDPFLTGLHEIMAELVEPSSKVLDVGSGTGNLAFLLAPAAAEVVGVELSPAMAEYATRQLDGETENVSFLVGDVSEVLADRPEGYFDVATMVLALHEMPAATRAPVLREITRVATKLLVLDYRVPMPWNLQGTRNRVAEALAGLEHLNAFRDFNRRGGTEGIATAASLTCEHVRNADKGTFAIHEITSPPQGERSPASAKPPAGG